MHWNYAKGFAASAEKYPENLAVVCGKSSLTYGALKTCAQKLAGQITPALKEKRVGVLASRSIETVTAFLGVAWAGGTYVPLGLNQPEARLIALFEHLELDALIVDERGAKKLSPALLKAAPQLILIPTSDAGEFEPHPQSTIYPDAPLVGEPTNISPEQLAYIVFTSGTTGMPKGVMVNGRSITLYMDAITPHYQLGPNDRAAETCEATFDLSIHNMLTAWRGGAALHIMRPLDLVAPARFIRTNAITTWLSVPSIVTLMRQAGGLKPDSLPSIRLTWFCGEPLAEQTVRDWSAAAPNSVIENFYGPTEITVAVVCQRWTGNGPVTPERGIVSIGKPIAGVQMLIVDQKGNEVPDGVPGEIVLAGEQCSSGYFRKPELSQKVFKEVGGLPGYFTGDRGYKDEDGKFHHLGRFDNQIKFKGHRIELEEIDARLREAAGATMVGTVAWPVNGDVIEGLAAFYSVPGLAKEEVRDRMRATLPPHMVPEHIENVSNMPLNANGKVDRKALIAILEMRSNPTIQAAE